MHKFKFWRSLKLRLFLIIFMIGMIPSSLVCQVIVRGYEVRAIKVRTSDAQTQLSILANHLITYNYLNDTSSEVINAELGLLSNLYAGRVMVIDNNLKVIKDTYSISEGKNIVSEEIVKCIKGTGSTNYDRANAFIEITVPITESITIFDENAKKEELEVYKGVLLTSVSTETINATIEILKNRANIFMAIFAILVFAIAIVLSRLLVKPFEKVQKGINGVKDGFSYESISVEDYLETENIVSSFNDLLERTRLMDESRQDFVANVSHELKTPMTSIKLLADSLNTMSDVPIEMYQSFMQDIADEIERENKVINDLLALVKLNKDASSLNISQVNINELVERILKRLRPIARKEDVEMVFVSNREVVAQVDEVKMSLMLTNLIENGIKYNVPQGKVTVTVDSDHENFTVEIADTGIGIPEADIAHIFERFYRVDKSHSREIGGTGLGLAISKSAVIRHKGTIEVSSTLGEGSIFTVIIPIKAPKE